jgi:hypothetical protein
VKPGIGIRARLSNRRMAACGFVSLGRVAGFDAGEFCFRASTSGVRTAVSTAHDQAAAL